MEGFDWLCLFDQTGFYLRNVIFLFLGRKTNCRDTQKCGNMFTIMETSSFPVCKSVELPCS